MSRHPAWIWVTLGALALATGALCLTGGREAALAAGHAATTVSPPAVPVAPPAQSRRQPLRAQAALPTPMAIDREEPKDLPLARPLRQELDGPLARSRALWLLGEDDDDAALSATARVLTLLDRHATAPLDLSVACRTLACRYSLSFPSLESMAELERVREDELDGRFVVGRPERASGDEPWVVVAYEFFDEDSVPPSED